MKIFKRFERVYLKKKVNFPFPEILSTEDPVVCIFPGEVCLLDCTTSIMENVDTAHGIKWLRNGASQGSFLRLSPRSLHHCPLVLDLVLIPSSRPGAPYLPRPNQIETRLFRDIRTSSPTGVPGICFLPKSPLPPFTSTHLPTPKRHFHHVDLEDVGVNSVPEGRSGIWIKI